VANTATPLAALVEPAVVACGYDFWGLEYLPQGRRSVLRVYIDSANGINVDICAQVSRQVSAVLDVEDPIAGEYYLEVSSPGIDRPLFTLCQYEQNIGKAIKLHLRLTIDGHRKLTGLLSNIKDEDIVLLVNDNEYLLPISSIDKANVVPHFEW
jgi:ribosome maturation factor RimP